MASATGRPDPLGARREGTDAARVRGRSALHVPGLAGALAAAPLLVACLICLAQTGHDLFPWGDHAIVEGETLRAWLGEQLLGTYSRYGWHHPGPALFYWMAPWHALFGNSPAAMNAAVAFLNAVALAAIAVVVRRCAGRTAALWAAALIGLYVTQQGPAFVRDFWIPHSVVFPFAALIALTAGAAAGWIELVPLVALVASFLAETDLSVAPASAAVLVAGLVFWLARRGWRELERNRRLALVVAVTAVVAVVVWYPPIHEQARSGKGNVTLLREFFKQPDAGHPLSEGVGAVANAVAVLPGGGRSAIDAVPASGVAKLFLFLTLILLAAGVVFGWRRERRFASALCAASLAAILAEIYAVTQIRGELFTYLTDWSGSAAIVAWIAIGCALAPGSRSREAPVRARIAGPALVGTAIPARAGIAGRALAGTAIPALAALAIGLAAWNTLDQATHASLPGNHDPAYSNPAQKPIDLAVRAWAAKNGVEKPLIAIPQNPAWPLAAGVYIDRVRHDKQVAIAPDWVGVFGEKFAPKGDEDATLTFADAAEPKPQLPAAAKPIARAGGVVVYATAAQR